MTLIGSAASKNGEHGILLRRGTGAIIMNSIVTGFKAACIDFDDKETFTNADQAEGINFYDSIIDCAGNEFSVEAEDVFGLEEFFTTNFDGMVYGPAKLDGYIPAVGSPALVNTDITPLDAFFDQVDFIGAVKDKASDWTKGWTTASVK